MKSLPFGVIVMKLLRLSQSLRIRLAKPRMPKVSTDRLMHGP